MMIFNLLLLVGYSGLLGVVDRDVLCIYVNSIGADNIISPC